MPVLAFVSPVARRIADIIGHLVAGIGYEILSPAVVASQDKKDSDACSKGSSKGGKRDSLGSLHMWNFVEQMQ